MSISAKDISKLEQVMKAEGPAHYRNRYVPGAEHVGIYRIFMIWPDKLKEIEEVDGEWRENAVTFLEVNPRYFRSGYDKSQLLRHLKRADLNPKHKQRLLAVLLDVVGRPSGVELRQYCQLAARLASKELASALSKLVKSEDEGVRRRASWMLEHVESAQVAPNSATKRRQARAARGAAPTLHLQGGQGGVEKGHPYEPYSS